MSRANRIKLADPCIEASDVQAVLSVLDSGRLVNGPRARVFEDELEKLTGRRHAIVVSSGTMALMASMKALGIGPGSTVLVPALTFPAPASAAAFLGARVRVTDVDPRTFNISCETLAPHVDDDVSLVIAIDQFGLPAPTPEIEKLLEPRGISVLVDAACSIGGSLQKRPAGSAGIVSTFSFHPRKVVTTGEGGAVLTDDDRLATEIRRLVNHGLEENGFASAGLNLRLGEVGAAIGIEQLARLGKTVERRRRLARRYRSLPIRFQEAPGGVETNFQTLAVVLPEGMTSADRQDLIECLKREEMEATVASYCLGALPAIATSLGLPPRPTPVAREIHDLGIALPLHEGLDETHIDEVIAVVHKWLSCHGVR